jgi:hypothetical protein
MKVLDLRCTHQHSFEGWFASEDDFQGQLSRGLVECPICTDKVITKMLSAPRLNLNSARGEPEQKTTASEPSASDTQKTESTNNSALANNSAAVPIPTEVANMSAAQLQAAWMQMVKHVVANTEDVGAQFSEEARKMHYGETEQRNIRGQATPEETQELLEEGIQVMPLPLPESLKGPLQ